LDAAIQFVVCGFGIGRAKIGDDLGEQKSTESFAVGRNEERKESVQKTK
jgi:hypothetical protein